MTQGTVCFLINGLSDLWVVGIRLCIHSPERSTQAKATRPDLKS